MNYILNANSASSYSRLRDLQGLQTSPKPSASYKYDRFHARVGAEGNLHLTWLKDKSQIGYAEVQKLRRASPLAQLKIPELADYCSAGYAIAHIGVSAAVIINFEGKKYAVFELRQRGSSPPFLLLISGYSTINEDRDGNDVPTSEVVRRAVLRELLEEMLVVDSSGRFLRAKLDSSSDGTVPDYQMTKNTFVAPSGLEGLKFPHQNEGNFKWSTDKMFTVTPIGTPVYACAVNSKFKVYIEGEEVKIPAYIYPQLNSVHFIAGFEVKLPSNLDKLSLLHAETKKLDQGFICEQVSLDGLVLLELDQYELPTPNAFQLIEGAVHPVKLPHNGEVSEMLTPPIFLDRSSIVEGMTSLNSYWDNLNRLRKPREILQIS